MVLVARGEHLRAVIRADGLTLAAPTAPARWRYPRCGTRARPASTSRPIVLLAVKSHQTADALEDLAGVAGPDTPVVSVQNGVANEPALLRFFDDVQGVCVMMPTGHLEPGTVVQHCSPVPGILDVGRYPTGVDATCQAVAEAFRSAGFVSEPRADVMAWKHRKLMANLGNAVDACCAPGPAAEDLATRARTEGETVLAAAGIPVVTEKRDRRRRGDLLQLAPGRRPRAGRRLVVAEPAAGHGQHRVGLPQRRGGAARPAARRAHAGQRRCCSGPPAGWPPTAAPPGSLDARDLLRPWSDARRTGRGQAARARATRA